MEKKYETLTATVTSSSFNYHVHIMYIVSTSDESNHIYHN